ncbi:hypothetical protein DD237_005603 [Peronospora effusa]|uniref:Matrin-type domain-containing protein n=1 Tax=Peronospora effusa TaxID=542832 RepID=A0A3R7W250_9STRA|nr:hypothetical protein DD237_005603 [Peronospora effusa]
MPRYYCDYCDTYLTHDSQAGRKQHNRGWKHRENVKLYYEQFLAGQGVVMTPGEWLRGPTLSGSLPPRPSGPPHGGMPGGYPPRGPPRGPPLMGVIGMRGPPGPSSMAQAFAHRLVEFADYEKCIQYFTDKNLDFDRPNVMGYTLLMSVCAYGRNDLVGFVVDRTTALDCGSITNRTTVLHLTAMSKNTLVMEELVATAERRHKVQKIIDQMNAHGDTALMMACVAKQVTAVQLLLEMGASMSAANASGLNALMCAARVGKDPRPGAPSIDEMMEQSASIVKNLLVHGADVNAVEKAGNTALHIAVLSENPIAVASLISNARNLDITLRNKAGNTALDLSKQISAVVSAQIEDLLSEKWAQYEIEAARMSAKVEQELMELAANEVEGASDRAKTTGKKIGKKKNRKNKKKAQATRNTIEESSAETSTSQELDGEIVENTNKMISASSVLDPASAEARLQSNATDHTVLGVDDREFENNAGPWQIVIPKNRRKELSSKNAEAFRQRNTKSSQRRLLANNNTSAKKPQITPKSETVLALEVNSGHSIAASSTATARKVPWASQPSPKPTKAFMSAPQHSQMALNEDAARTTRSIMSYDIMNESFHRTFPVAAELEIDVEKFLIASSVSDRELEPTESLSISQVEVLQESHWQAYHYLNEKKIELTRVLEAQRIEAQFNLQQELMQLK